MIPILMIENSQQQRHTAAAVESFRNESVRQNDTITQVLAQGIRNQALLSSVEETKVQILPSDIDG